MFGFLDAGFAVRRACPYAFARDAVECQRHCHRDEISDLHNIAHRVRPVRDQPIQQIGDRLPFDIIHEVHLPFAVALAFALFDVGLVETATQSSQQLRKIFGDVMMTIEKW